MSFLKNGLINFVDRVELPDLGWSIGIPEKFAYSMDPSVNGNSGTNPSGVYDFILIKPKSGFSNNFTTPYSNAISFVSLDYLSEMTKNQMLTVLTDVTEIVNTDALKITFGQFSSFGGIVSYQVFITCISGIRRFQLMLCNPYAIEGKAFAIQLLKSIRVIDNQIKNDENLKYFSEILAVPVIKLNNHTENTTKNIDDQNNEIYINACELMNNAGDEKAYRDASKLFGLISGYKDADTLEETCFDFAEKFRKDSILTNAKNKMTESKLSSIQEAITLFTSIVGWKDADEQLIICRRKITEIKAIEEAAAKLEAERKAEEHNMMVKKNRRIITIIVSVCIAVALINFLILLLMLITSK